MTTGSEIGVMLPQPRDTWSHQKMEEAGKDFPPKDGRGHSPADILVLDLWPPELCKESISDVLSLPVYSNLS